MQAIVNDISSALKYLAETDEPYAKAKGYEVGLKYKVKVAKSLAYLKTTGKVAQREAESLTSEEYATAIENHENAIIDCETYRAKRKRAELTIEVWRTENANRRTGNV